MWVTDSTGLKSTHLVCSVVFCMACIFATCCKIIVKLTLKNANSKQLAARAPRRSRCPRHSKCSRCSSFAKYPRSGCVAFLFSRFLILFWFQLVLLGQHVFACVSGLIFVWSCLMFACFRVDDRHSCITLIGSLSISLLLHTTQVLQIQCFFYQQSVVAKCFVAIKSDCIDSMIIDCRWCFFMFFVGLGWALVMHAFLSTSMEFATLLGEVELNQHGNWDWSP